MSPDPFEHQENDDVQAELTDNNLLDDVENQSDEAVFLDDISSFPAYTTPSLTPNCELKCYDNPVNIYLLNVNSRNTRTRCEIYSKLAKKTPE